MTIKQIRPHVYHIKEINNQHILAFTFIRLQEFFESPYPNIRNNYFTLEEIMDIYAKNNNGTFSYFSDWSGFNIPGNIVKNFFTMFGHNLLEKEKKLQHLILQNIPEYDTGNFYLIATDKDRETIRHELAHSYFFLLTDYKKTMIELCEQFEHRKKFNKKLLNMGYCNPVLLDEIQAYMATSFLSSIKEFFNIRSKGFKKYMLPFKKVFDKANIEQKHIIKKRT